MLFKDSDERIDAALTYILAARPNMMVSRFLADWRRRNSSQLSAYSQAISLGGVRVIQRLLGNSSAEDERRQYARAALLAALMGGRRSLTDIGEEKHSIEGVPAAGLKVNIRADIARFGLPPRQAHNRWNGGLATRLEEFCGAACAVYSTWNDYRSADERREALSKSAFESLKASGVPEPRLGAVPVALTVIAGHGKQSMLGQFNNSEWSLKLLTQPFANPGLARDDFALLANVTFHECRHCEQAFRAARLAAGGFQSSEESMVNKTRIPLRVARAAMAAPLPASAPELPIVARWYENFWGDDPMFDVRRTMLGQINRNLNEKGNALQRTGGRVALSRDLLRELQRPTIAYDAAYQRYRTMPVEDDAHWVGDAVEARVKQLLNNGRAAGVWQRV